MRRRTSSAERGRPEDVDLDRISRDLEDRGVPTDFSMAMAERLGLHADQLDTAAYLAALDAAAAAFTVYRSGEDGVANRARTVDEIRRLMRGFADELRKLEEGLQVVSAYVLRMQDKAGGSDDHTLH